MIHVTVISPAGTVFQGDATGVVAPAYDGRVGILPRHAPFMTILGDGVLDVRQEERARQFRVRGGFLQVADDQVLIVAEYAEGEPHAS